MSKQYPNVLRKLYGEPWAISENNFHAIAEIVERHMEKALSADDIQFAEKGDQRGKMDQVSVMNGVAVIPIAGPIIKGASVFQRISGATSPEAISKQFDQALAMDDDEVKSILLHIDSPGGQVTGVAELASKIYAARSQTNKSIIALADGSMASAAYWIGSQAEAVFATEMSQVGSIGVYASVYDDTRRMRNEGVDPTVFRSHELKGIGEGPVTPSQATAVQTAVMKTFDVFKSAVTRARHDIDIDKVANGLTWFGQEAVDLNLIDGVTTFDQIIKIYGK
jgi:signal peptide peptidase SppA